MLENSVHVSRKMKEFVGKHGNTIYKSVALTEIDRVCPDCGNKLTKGTKTHHTKWICNNKKCYVDFVEWKFTIKDWGSYDVLVSRVAVI